MIDIDGLSGTVVMIMTKTNDGHFFVQCGEVKLSPHGIPELKAVLNGLVDRAYGEKTEKTMSTMDN